MPIHTLETNLHSHNILPHGVIACPAGLTIVINVRFLDDKISNKVVTDNTFRYYVYSHAHP